MCSTLERGRNWTAFCRGLPFRNGFFTVCPLYWTEDEQQARLGLSGEEHNYQGVKHIT